MSDPQRRKPSPSTSPSSALRDGILNREQASGNSEVGDMLSTQQRPAILDNTAPPTCKPPLKRKRRDNGDDDDEGTASAVKHICLLTAADIEQRLCSPLIFNRPSGDLELLATSTTTAAACQDAAKQDAGLAAAVLDASRAKENHRTGYGTSWSSGKCATYEYRTPRFVPPRLPVSPTRRITGAGAVGRGSVEPACLPLQASQGDTAMVFWDIGIVSLKALRYSGNGASCGH
ncbi:hypothetical protein LTR85_000628 [Meristemomyces frigidus]|nr:hypothetical protein LTR85_000628 [Meristemomyces frigidus]